MWWIIALCAVAAYYFYKRSEKQRLTNRLMGKIRQRRLHRERSIAHVKETLNDVPVERREVIHAMNFQQLTDGLQSGEVSALQALKGLQEKALQAHEKTNCITQFIKEAEHWANELDSLAKSPNYKKPPFFGMPISIKESVTVAGYDQTRGYAQDLGKISSNDGVMVECFKKLGAVPFVLTNVPQSLLSYSCSNPIYGTTTNPFDSTRTPGGSSGGESALIADGGSLLGLGGDVGGSIRAPCHFTGLAGIKPSHTRLSERGSMGSVPGRPLINSSEGPLAVDVDACVYMMKNILSNEWLFDRDPYVAPVPWRGHIYNSTEKLRIGYYDHDGWMTPTPALRRAVHEAKTALEQMGHTLVPFDPPGVPQAFANYVAAVSVDGGRYLKRLIDQDILEKDHESVMRLYSIPMVLSRALSHLVRPFYPRLATVMSCMPMTTSELRLTYENIGIYRDTFADRMRQLQLDALICPAQVMPAVAHDVPMKVFATVSYTAIFNLLDYSAGVVRVTTVTEEDEQNLLNYPVIDYWDNIIKNACKGAVGLPVAVQCVSAPYTEEVTLRIMKLLETHYRQTK